MGDAFDLVVANGSLVDGTGTPARPGELAIRDGRIAALGRPGELAPHAVRVLDGCGGAIAPGFVDVHTHYDAQVFWDRTLSPSSWHGVTSVIVGNCGFGVAPTRPEHRDLVLRTLENVEGMSLDALRAGLGSDWPFERFGEFLSAIEARGTAIHVGALVGHTPVRTWVMGDAATEREATEDEVAAMRALVAEALRGGALGFATSKSPTHVGYAGRPVPSRAAARAEIDALAACLAEAGHGVLQCTIGSGLFLDEMEQIAAATGRPVSWTALLGGMLGPDGHRGVLARCASMQARGVRVIPQVSCRPLLFEFQFKAPFPYEPLPCFRRVSRADLAGRKAIYADPAFRREFGAQARRWSETVISSCPTEPALEERTVAAVAEERGVDPVDLALDLALASELEARFRIGIFNTDDAVVAELLAHPAAMLGLSDAGAHASQLCDAGAPTTLLGKWVRELGVLSLEEGVRRLTSEPADVFGLSDRGRLAPGLAADVVVFDPAAVGCGPVRRVHDFPAGADRLVADAHGICSVLVEGVPIREDGREVADPRRPLPGRVLRGG
jgi:N-acyl-D-aspartate/D-glutamate deacylase